MEARGKKTQRDFGDVGLYATTLSPLENGQTLVTNETRRVFETICDKLDLTASYFEPELSNAIKACRPIIQKDVGDDKSIDVFYKDCTYTVGSDRMPNSWESITVYRPRKQPLTAVQESYIYTDVAGSEELEVLTGGWLEGPVRAAATGYRTYVLNLGRTVRVGETHLVHEVFKFPNAKVVPAPFATVSVQLPIEICEHMIIRVQFHHSCVPHRIFRGEGSVHLAGLFDKEKELSIGPDQTYFECEASNVPPYRHHGFRWTWTN